MRKDLGWVSAALTALLLAGCGTGNAAAAPSAKPTLARATATSAQAVPASLPLPTTLPATSSAPIAVSPAPARHTPSTTLRPAVQQVAVRSLPLDFPTGSATQVVTVVATDTHATTAVLQTWDKVDGGWLPIGSSVTADVGRNGMTANEAEGDEAAPIGSFTLTQAFGRDADPGSGLPYFQTTPDDWWISEPGPLYNTHQNCSANCAFNTSSTGNPNEHLYYEIPYYNYAVVIDYNTANAGPVVQGAGSAFFLHVTTGKPTLGCVAIPTSALLPLMRWLNPADHPRILIGTA